MYCLWTGLRVRPWRGRASPRQACFHSNLSGKGPVRTVFAAVVNALIIFPFNQPPPIYPILYLHLLCLCYFCDSKWKQSLIFRERWYLNKTLDIYCKDVSLLRTDWPSFWTIKWELVPGSVYGRITRLLGIYLNWHRARLLMYITSHSHSNFAKLSIIPCFTNGKTQKLTGASSHSRQSVQLSHYHCVCPCTQPSCARGHHEPLSRPARQAGTWEKSRAKALWIFSLSGFIYCEE